MGPLNTVDLMSTNYFCKSTYIRQGMLSWLVSYVYQKYNVNQLRSFSVLKRFSTHPFKLSQYMFIILFVS